MNYILFDDYSRSNLLPLTFTCPVADIRIGILTVREKWETRIGQTTSSLTENYLRVKFPFIVEKENVLINGGILPEEELINEIMALKPGQKLISGNTLIALKISGEQVEEIISTTEKEDENSFNLIGKINLATIKSELKIFKIEALWDVFSKNGEAIQQDFNLLTKGRISQIISDSNKVFARENIFVEKGAIIEGAILNASKGPVYIGENAEIMEGSLIRGPFALGESSVLKLGAKIYGPTTIGPFCKIGGEINNSVMFGYSNKAHDGFLGNSVIGEWCNLGADTNNSNLKNNYGEVKMWNYNKEGYINTNLQFCGLIMADHSKCGINTMFNTGTVVGVNANIFGAGFPKKFIPCFSWGGADGLTTFTLEKSFEVAAKVWERRGKIFNHVEKDIFKNIFEHTSRYRRE